MSKITYPNKSTGDQFKATEANEIKASVNSLYDGLTVKSIDSVSEFSTIDSTFADVIFVNNKERTAGNAFVPKTGLIANGGTIYAGNNGTFWEIQNNILNPEWFGAKGDSVYSNTGGNITSGTYNETALTNCLLLQEDGGESKQGGSLFNIPVGIFRLHSQINGFNIATNNTFINGSGSGSSIFHFERSSSTDEIAIVFGRNEGDASGRLLRGGGIKDISLVTNNANIINNGVQLDYVEYVSFENIVLDGFYKKALYGGFWESYFKNIVIRGSGAGITSTSGIPDYGVLDFDSHTTLDFRDACNNTTFDKLTFSSCFGTHIRAVAAENTIVNININGLYDETYNIDAGSVDELPIYYFDAISNFNISGGFLTVNSTGVVRNGCCVKISNDVRNGWVNFSEFVLSHNHISNNWDSVVQRVSSFIVLDGQNSMLSLENCTIDDPSNSVTGNYLIDGAGGYIKATNLTINVKEGSRTINNIFNPAISLTGDITLVYFDNTGKTGDIETFHFVDSVSIENKYVDKITDAGQHMNGRLVLERTTDPYNTFLKTNQVQWNYGVMSGNNNFRIDNGGAGVQVTQDGKFSISNCPQFADNAAAIAGGLTVGQLYRTADTIKIVH